MSIENQVLQALEWRYATKRFDSAKKISPETWHVLQESLRLAPSAYGLQPWRFLVVQNPELRVELQKASWNQSQVSECSHFVVFTYKKSISEEDVRHYIETVSRTRGVALEQLEGYERMIVGDIVKGRQSKQMAEWTQRQQYIAMGFLLETAALLKVDTCPMEGLDPAAYDRILGLESTEWTTLSAVALGYRQADDRYATLKKVRLNASELIEFRS